MSIVMYLKQTCPYCVMAKRLLAAKGQEWTEIDIQADPARRAEMIERTGRYTVPQQSNSEVQTLGLLGDQLPAFVGQLPMIPGIEPFYAFPSAVLLMTFMSFFIGTFLQLMWEDLPNAESPSLRCTSTYR